MPDPILIATLVTAVITGITQLVQIYFDYKRDVAGNQQEHIYTFTSACCSTINESEHEEHESDK